MTNSIKKDRKALIDQIAHFLVPLGFERRTEDAETVFVKLQTIPFTLGIADVHESVPMFSSPDIQILKDHGLEFRALRPHQSNRLQARSEGKSCL